jgi:diguanylate cyclase (GGDEF)-like protein
LSPSVPEHPLVLVVDDDGPSRTVARAALERGGFAVAEAPDGAAALAKLADLANLAAGGGLRPDVVLLDVVMPGMDGYATCRALRESPEGRTVPVLMVTSLDDHEAIARAFDAGATDFVMKPVHWATLLHRVRYMIRAGATAEALRRSEARLANAQRIARLGHWEWDVRADRLTCSDIVLAVFGLAPERFGCTFGSFTARVHRGDRGAVLAAFRGAMKGGGALSADFRVVRAEGVVRVARLEAEVERGADGRPRRLSGTLQDITERHEAEARIQHMALHDALTDLPNRILFKERLARTLERARRARRKAAVLFVGLDRFTRINASLGYDVGDRLLKEAALRLTGCLEVAAGAGMKAEISRFGGDEFTLVLDRVGAPEDVATLARRILDILAESYALSGQDVYTTTSIGIALFPEDGERVQQLLKNADAALRHAKRQGKNTFRFYSPAMNAGAERRLALESDLQKALDRDELLLHYQPTVAMDTGRPVGFEALLRWNHPRLGLVAPGDFVPLAEETGLIVPIGEWVLSTACAQGRRWREAGLPALRIAVNLSARQFWQEDLAPTVGRILVETRLDPRMLDLELTESTFMQDAEATVAALRSLKEMGLTLSVDDFGTGYSSLAYLQRFPLDALKIDRSFVRDVTQNPDSAAITRTVISMARGLNLRVVAEGIEDADQYAFLKTEGCHEGQGYYIARPMPAADVPAFVRAASGAPAARRRR